MWAFALALAILMWLWVSISRMLVQRLAGMTPFPIRMAWLGVAIAAGMAVLMLVAWMLLPDSYVSRGWTRELLEQVQQRAALLVLVVGLLGFAAEWFSSGARPGNPGTGKSRPERR